MKKTWVLLGLLLSVNAYAADVDVKNNSVEAIQTTSSDVELKVAPVAVNLSTTIIPTFSLLKSDKTVKNALERWTSQVGWQLDWDVAIDFPIRFEANYGGDFEMAINGLLASLEATDYPVQSCGYSNNILRVVRYGEILRCEIRK